MSQSRTYQINEFAFLGDDSKLICVDCGQSLDNREDWEPFILHGEHVAVCVPCIADCYTHEDCILRYANINNVSVSSPIVSDTDIREFLASGFLAGRDSETPADNECIPDNECIHLDFDENQDGDRTCLDCGLVALAGDVHYYLPVRR